MPVWTSPVLLLLLPVPPPPPLWARICDRSVIIGAGGGVTRDLLDSVATFPADWEGTGGDQRARKNLDFCLQGGVGAAVAFFADCAAVAAAALEGTS